MLAIPALVSPVNRFTMPSKAKDVQATTTSTILVEGNII